MTNTNKNWFQLIGTAIDQGVQIIKYKKQLKSKQKELCPEIEEHSVPDIEEYIRNFKENPTSCKFLIYTADRGLPVYALDQDATDTIFCPKYNKECECANHTCDHHKNNAEFFNLQNEFETAKQNHRTTVRQIFGLRTK